MKFVQKKAYVFASLLALSACGISFNGCSGTGSQTNNKTAVNNGKTNNGTTTNNGKLNNKNNGSNNGSTGTTPFVVAPSGLDARPDNTTCLAKTRPPATTNVTLERAFPNLTFRNPLLARQAPGDDSKWYVVEKRGSIRVFDNDNDTDSDAVFADISDKIVADGEKGLLGFTFHPDWKDNQTVFLSYTLPPGDRPISIISKFTIKDGEIDRASEVELIRLEQPYGNHNGGDIEFGPDGFLYISFGDGGSGGDPQKHGQNKNTLLGAMLRIDVDKSEDGKNYAIPSDNPFAQNGGAKEIYAWGLRNVWRFSFDTESGKLWAADVGQVKFEEVSIIERGGNYGWSQKEGFDCYDAAPPCDKLPFIDPIIDYPRSEGKSITGGYVYRGSELPSMVGKFIFADFDSLVISAVAYDPLTGKPVKEDLLNAGFRIASFAQGNDGEVYALDFSSGRFMKLKGPAEQNNDFPDLLSKTGCMDSKDVTKPGPGLLQYDVNAPFWSDGAAKKRYMALPNGEKITLDADGDFVFPIGSVLVKEFSIDNKLVETRLMMRHDDGDWGTYLYEWNDDLSDAKLLLAEKTKTLANGQSYNFPSRADCLTCHTAASNRVLGLEIAQLNKSMNYASTRRISNQITTLRTIDVLDDELGDIETLAALVDPFGDADLDKRARSYLHTNCASCHLDGNDLRVDFDFRFTASLNDFCNDEVLKPFDLSDPKVIKPGDPENSVALYRTGRRDADAMPPMGSNLVDVRGTALLSEWIAQLTCP